MPLTAYYTRNSKNIASIEANHRIHRMNRTIIEWSKLDSNIRCSTLLQIVSENES